MDYTEIPRSLIYKERTDLKDFGVHVPETMNHLLFLNLKELFKATDGKKELILRCFNNAYYICTIIPFEDFPETQVAEYEKLLFKGNPYDCEEICAVSMAMVCKLLPASDARWKPENNDLIETIRYRFTHYQWMNRGARKSFEFMEGKHNTDGLIISPSEFAPRDILELIENHIEKPLLTYADYICERLALLKDPSQRVYGTDLAIARIKDYQRVLCEECEYNPKKDSFKHTVNYNPIRDLSWEESVRDNYQKSKEAIDYYRKHYPTKEENDSTEKATESSQLPETEDLQTKTKEMESKLTHQVDELQRQLSEKTQALQEAHQIIEEFRQPVKELTAKQKIRMEFAVQLLIEAGLSEKNLEKENRNKSKVASLLSLLLGIGATICANFLVDRNYCPQEKDRDTILELDKLCLELGISAHLSTQKQGN